MFLWSWVRILAPLYLVDIHLFIVKIVIFVEKTIGNKKEAWDSPFLMATMTTTKFNCLIA